MPPVPHSYTGVIHVHTDMSDGEGTLDQVLAAARSCEVDFVVLTDHATRGYVHEGMEGWHDNVLVMCGEEVSTDEGHFLCLEAHGDVGNGVSIEEAVERSRSQGGTLVSVHHQLPDGGPPVLPHSEVDVVEIWSFTDEFLSRAQGQRLPLDMERAVKLIDGPSRRLLRLWDRELRRRMLPVIGGLNAHQRKEPLLEWRAAFPYETSFRTIATVVQAPELPKVGSRACALLWNALRQGRSYLVNRDVANEKGFHFEYAPPHGRCYMMGETAPYAKGGHFRITVPVEAEIVLRHNGQPLFWGTGQQVSFPTASPGSYRVEVFLHRRLYILSNPIRLVDDDNTIHPTVSDVT